MTTTDRRAEVREAILDTADRLFERYGYRKTTVEDIADAARVSRGTIYLYFRTKEELALAWSARFSQRRCGILRAIARTEGRATDRLRRMLRERVLFSFDRAQHYTMSLDEVFAMLRPALLEQRERNHEAEAAIFAEVLQEGRALGVLDVEDALTVARLLIAMTNSLLPYSLSAHQLGERSEIERKVDGIAEIVLKGLERRDARRPAGTGAGPCDPMA